MKHLLALFLFLVSVASYSQVTQDDKYRYFVNLKKVADDKLTVELITPKMQGPAAKFMFPAMVPGTYSVYNFGRFISDLKAYDQSGGELETTKPDINTWEIINADKLYRITYSVRETFGDQEDPKVFEPVGTCIDEGKVFVFNNQGFFGYFDGMVNSEYVLSFEKPEGFYGSTSMPAVSRTETLEIFSSPDYHEVVDSPIMFTKPDTATIRFDEMTVLISVYSPGKGLTAKDYLESNTKLLEAIRRHLGGTLPADRYTFLYFFADDLDKGSGGFGALEHKYSSFYYMPDVPAQAKSMMVSQMQSTNAHEFYHIVTPLNLHSEEIGNFDYNNPVMSKHLWLYEGVTEYFADYIQLREGLMDLANYLDEVEGKMNSSMRFNDSLAFTEMSKGALDKYKNEYVNVYEKGALIGLCLDIMIRKESGGRLGLQDVINQLLGKYGKERSFIDDELFSEIEALTGPEVRKFLDTYVDGPNRIPYDKILSEIGLTVKSTPYEVVDMGGVEMGFNVSTFRLKINKLGDPDNEFVNKLGLKEGDELVSVNGMEINFMNAMNIFGSAKKQAKAGDKIDLVVARMDGDKYENVKLSSVVSKTRTNYEFDVTETENKTDSQKSLFSAWKK